MSSAEHTFIEQARRRQIVAAAVDVLADEGFRAATLTRIAERAGISKPLILYHFASKDDLLRQTLFDTVESLATEAMADLDLGAPTPTVLRELVRHTAAMSGPRRRQRRAISQIIASLGPRGGDAPVVGPADAEPLLAGLEAMFRAGQAAGHFRADLDARVMAVTYQATTDAMFAQLDAHPELDPLAYADALSDILVAAVEAR